MGQAGIFKETDRVELIEGEIIEMSPIGSRHSGHVKRIRRLLDRFLGDDVILGVQDPVILNDFTEPEPDISILKPRADYYEESHPRPEDVIFLVEVADSSLAYDRKVKLRQYALAGITEYWIINIEEQIIEVFRSPIKEAYAIHLTYYSDQEDEIIIPTFDLKISIKDLFR